MSKSNSTPDTPLILTLTATVSRSDFERFAADHTGPADIVGSFNARLNEVFGSGPEVLTTIQVRDYETTDTPTPATAPMLNEFYEREARERSINAEHLARKARKAVKRSRKALLAYFNKDFQLEDFVDRCFEGEAARVQTKMMRDLQELANTLRYVREQANYTPERREDG